MGAKPDVGMKCIQYLLFIINFMFAIVGTLLITSAAAILVAYREYDIFVESQFFRPAEIVIAIGVIILLVSMFGGISAIKESTLYVKLYSFLLLLLIILEVCAIIAGFIMRGSIRSTVEGNMIDSLFNYKNSSEAQTSWDYIQQRFHCCGVHYPNNWAAVHVSGHEVFENGYNYTVPYSCCKTSLCSEMFNWSCLNILESYLSDIAFMLIYITISVGVTQVLGLVFACMLTKTIRRIKTEEERQRQRAYHLVYNQIASEQQQATAPVDLGTPTSTYA